MELLALAGIAALVAAAWLLVAGCARIGTPS
jgi:hypothetical protein